MSMPRDNDGSVEPLRHAPVVVARVSTRADTGGRLDWTKVMVLSWRPAWSIRSRRGSVGPFLDMLRDRRGGLRAARQGGNSPGPGSE